MTKLIFTDWISSHYKSPVINKHTHIRDYFIFDSINDEELLFRFTKYLFTYLIKYNGYEILKKESWNDKIKKFMNHQKKSFMNTIYIIYKDGKKNRSCAIWFDDNYDLIYNIFNVSIKKMVFMKNLSIKNINHFINNILFNISLMERCVLYISQNQKLFKKYIKNFNRDIRKKFEILKANRETYL